MKQGLLARTHRNRSFYVDHKTVNQDIKLVCCLQFLCFNPKKKPHADVQAVLCFLTVFS